jgi:hypothetical protein
MSRLRAKAQRLAYAVLAHKYWEEYREAYRAAFAGLLAQRLCDDSDSEGEIG